MNVDGCEDMRADLSGADLIAEKDKEIQRLEKLCENYRCDCDNLAIMTDTMRKAGRTLRQKMNHQKYKRCLAMASLWLERSETSTDLENELVSRKRCNKWLELAKKFKDEEAK